MTESQKADPERVRFITITISDNEGGSAHPDLAIVHEGVSIYEVQAILGVLLRGIDDDIDTAWGFGSYEQEEAEQEEAE